MKDIKNQLRRNLEYTRCQQQGRRPHQTNLYFLDAKRRFPLLVQKEVAVNLYFRPIPSFLSTPRMLPRRLRHLLVSSRLQPILHHVRHDFADLKIFQLLLVCNLFNFGTPLALRPQHQIRKGMCPPKIDTDYVVALFQRDTNLFQTEYLSRDYIYVGLISRPSMKASPTLAPSLNSAGPFFIAKISSPCRVDYPRAQGSNLDIFVIMPYSSTRSIQFSYG